MEQFSTVRPLVIASEKPGHGEDAYIAGVYHDQLCYMGVFDGCGGLGARHYAMCQNHSGAWIGSRVAAYAMESYILRGEFQFTDASIQALEERIYGQLQRAKALCTTQQGIRLGGDLSRSMPTTISFVAARPDDEDKIFCDYLWAGDSRGYLLNRDGLCQITTDDVDINAEDAFLNMREDGRHTNVANGDKAFTLHSRHVKTSSPVVLVTSTDGGFNYFMTPMDFEYLLLGTMMQVQTPERWKNLIQENLQRISGDDYTVTIACFGFSDFAAMQSHFRTRCKRLEERYILPQQNATEEQLMALWMDYKPTYYRGGMIKPCH